MKIYEYQHIMTMDSGSTTYESDIIDYFKIDRSKTYPEIQEILSNIIKLEPTEIKKSVIKVGNKKFKVQNNIGEATFEQFAQLEMILAEEDNIKNLHKLITIYLQPINFIGRAEKFDMNKFEINSEYIKEKMDINMAIGLLVFFWNYVPKFMRNIAISYLNQNQMKYEW